MKKILLTGAFKYSKDQLAEIERLGYEIIYIQDERIPLKEQSIDFDISEVEAVVCNGLFLYNDIKEFSNLKFIQLTSAGMDRVPIEYIKENEIEIFNARGIYSIPMAEWAVLKILEIYKQSRYFYKNQTEKTWLKHRDLLELNDKTVSIIGFGSVGLEVAIRLKAFRANVIAVDSRNIEDDEIKYVDRLYNPNDVKTAIQESDIVVLTLPLTEKTKHIIDKNIFNVMNENTVLINISRGGVIDEEALIETLEQGRLLGAALDVFEEEPLLISSKLWSFENVIITPHNSFLSDKVSKRLFEKIYTELREYTTRREKGMAK